MYIQLLAFPYCRSYTIANSNNRIYILSSQTGQKLIMELDNIFPKCYESISGISDILKLRRCIINELGITNNGVKILQRDVNAGKYNAELAINIVNSQTSDCLSNVYSDARLQVAEAISTADRCLKAL